MSSFHNFFQGEGKGSGRGLAPSQEMHFKNVDHWAFRTRWHC